MNQPITNLRDIKTQRTPFKKLFKEAFQYGFSSQDSDTPYYKQIQQLNQYTAAEKFTTISQCYMAVDINKMLYMSPTKMMKYIEKRDVEFLENNTVYFQPLCAYISDCMERKHVVSITLSFENYIYDETENTQVTHSALIILYPVSRKRCSSSKKKQYDMFYINSHGGALFHTDFHEKPVLVKQSKHNMQHTQTSVKIKKTTFDKPIDFIVTNMFVKTLNRYNKSYGVNARVNYDLSSQHNYLGINLQYHDNHGACFIFPILFNLILHTNYNKYFISKSNTYSIIVEKTVECLLESKQIDLLVYHSLAQIDDRINRYLEKYYMNMRKMERINKRQIKTRACIRNALDVEDIKEELYDCIDDHLDVYTHRFVKATLTKTMQFIKQDWTRYQTEMFV